MEFFRVFIAIDIPDDVKNKIVKIQNSLPDFIGKKTEPENLHLTLKFLGEIDSDKIKEVKQSLRKITFNGFETEVDEIGVFSEHFIKIVWVHMTNCDKLQKDVDKNLSKMFQPERRFMSHLTIARIKKVKDRNKFLSETKEIKFDKIKFKVKEFKLKKSILTEKGPIYKDLEVYSLK